MRIAAPRRRVIREGGLVGLFGYAYGKSDEPRWPFKIFASDGHLYGLQVYGWRNLKPTSCYVEDGAFLKDDCTLWRDEQEWRDACEELRDDRLYLERLARRKHLFAEFG